MHERKITEDFSETLRNTDRFAPGKTDRFVPGNTDRFFLGSTDRFTLVPYLLPRLMEFRLTVTHVIFLLAQPASAVTDRH